MTTIIHMETEQVRQAARLLERSAINSHDLLGQIQRMAWELPWSGPSQEAFIHEIDAWVKNARTVIEEMEVLARRVQEEIEEWLAVDSSWQSGAIPGRSEAARVIFLPDIECRTMAYGLDDGNSLPLAEEGAALPNPAPTPYPLPQPIMHTMMVGEDGSSSPVMESGVSFPSVEDGFSPPVPVEPPVLPEPPPLIMHTMAVGMDDGNPGPLFDYPVQIDPPIPEKVARFVFGGPGDPRLGRATTLAHGEEG